MDGHTSRKGGVNQEALQDVDLMLILVGVGPAVAHLLQAPLLDDCFHCPCCLLDTGPSCKAHLQHMHHHDQSGLQSLLHLVQHLRAQLPLLLLPPADSTSTSLMSQALACCLCSSQALAHSKY